MGDRNLLFQHRIASACNSIVEAAIALYGFTIKLSEEQWHGVKWRSHCRACDRMLSRDNGIVERAIEC